MTSAHSIQSPLAGKVVVVAGAAGAAGPPTVAALAAQGATVIAVDNDATRLDPVVSAAQQNAGEGASVEALVVDLLDDGATTAAFADVLARHGRIDGLMHLVGGWRGGVGIVESDLGDWNLLNDLLVRTLQHTTRATHDALVTSGGRLAIVSTTQAQKPTAKNAAYAAAKAAAEAWTLAVAHSFKDTETAATIVQVKALVNEHMRAQAPERKFPGATETTDLATELTGLFALPASELNGQRRNLTQ